MAKRTLQELTIGNNFMFGAVMCDEENCKGLIEMVIGTPIDRIEVSKEKSMVYHPEYKGVRLDVYAKDEKNTHYNIEMQMLKNTSLGKRSRYYQSQIDMELLLKGSNYDELPNTYVIFICDFDPFGQKSIVILFTITVKNLVKLLWKMEDALFISVPAGRMQRKFQKNW